jgi:hypothetical protein
MNQTIVLNGDFFYDLNIIAQDEGLLKRAVRYVKKLAREKQTDPTLMTEEAFYAKLDRAEREIAEGKGTSFTNLDDMHAWLNSL